MRKIFQWGAGMLLGGMIMIAAAYLFNSVGGKHVSAGNNATKDSPAAEQRIPVTITPATMREFEESLTVQGNLQSKNFAIVSQRIPGVIDAIYVELGDTVVAGKTKLLQTDALRASKAVEISKQDLAVAECAQRESQANLDMLQAQFDKALLDYERFKRLRAQNAITPDAFEQQESRYKQTNAGLTHAKTLIDLAAEKKRQAEAALAIAERNLSDSLVYAPINGRVTHRLREPGEMGDAGTPILRIADPATLEVSAFLPAQYYGRVRAGETKLRLHVSGIDAGEQTIFYKSPSIEPALRTFEIKCLLNNPADGIVAGAIADIEVVIERRKGVGAPASAIQTRNEKSVLFIVEKDKAKMQPAATGLQSAGWVELTDNTIPEGTPIISMGQFLLNDGTPVTVQRETK